VIDVDEARSLLGTDLIIGDSPEIGLAEKLYRQFDLLNYQLGSRLKKRLIVLGSFLAENILVMKKG